MSIADFVVIGSSGGGATISWVLAKAGFDVVVLEQGDDFSAQVRNHLASAGEQPKDYNSRLHDEYRFQRESPHVWKRPRSDYNTWRPNDSKVARPLSGMGGMTASVLGGGSVFWGAWAFRAAPIDFRLATHFKKNKQLDDYKKWDYSIIDWPVQYAEMEPYFNVAETLLAVSGNRKSIADNIKKSAWYKEFSGQSHFKPASEWEPAFEFPCPEIVKTPVGWFIGVGMDKAKFGHFLLPSGMVSPRVKQFDTRSQIEEALKAWGSEPQPGFWKQQADEIWSDRIRTACNMCGYCGGYLCWGKQGPKSNAALTTLAEISELSNADIRTRAKAFEVMYDRRLRRATGVRYLDLADPENPVVRVQRARNVIVSCGAVQSARLLRMSGPPTGLGNTFDQLGRNVTFHMFDLVATHYLQSNFQGYLHSEFAHTGNTATFANYFVKDDDKNSEIDGIKLYGKWCKAGTMVSTAKHNALGDALRYYEKGSKRFDNKSSNSHGHQYLVQMERHARKMQLRLTGDDFPRPENRVDLDPTYVDEYGFPVARITRQYGPHEKWIAKVIKGQMEKVFAPYLNAGVLEKPESASWFKKGSETLIGDHQHGTCRMGEDPRNSVVDRYCRVHDVSNLFVVDTSVFPTGFGLNPMVNVVANALRVGTWIVQEASSGRELG